MPNIVEMYPCLLAFSGTSDVDFEIIPQNDKANAKLASWFTAHGAKTTVAYTQTDAGRAGLGSSLTPYDTLKVASS